MLPVMIEPRHRWVFPDPLRVAPEFRDAAREQGIGTFAATVLARRGIGDARSLAAFLGPARAGLNDPRLLPDADTLVARVVAARDHGERVMVFGDFDADGLTGLAQLVITLRRLGLDARPYVPSRLEEGHGLSMAAVEAAAADGVTLVVTVDTGSTSVAEIAAAGERGIDVLVTDHHRLPEVLPAAVAIVNPHRADARYPDPELSARPRRRKPSRWRTWPRSARCRTWRPSWARTGRSRASAWTACGRRRGRGSQRCWPGLAWRPSGWTSRMSASCWPRA
jgi:single-stranded-DNA-specific exonuclease